jgi:hypothetical protein
VWPLAQSGLVTDASYRQSPSKMPPLMSHTSGDSGMTSDNSRRQCDCFPMYRMRTKLAVNFKHLQVPPEPRSSVFCPHALSCWRSCFQTATLQSLVRHCTCVKLKSRIQIRKQVAIPEIFATISPESGVSSDLNLNIHYGHCAVLRSSFLQSQQEGSPIGQTTQWSDLYVVSRSHLWKWKLGII